MKKLMLVESPGKIHTLNKILGPEFTVLATIGHMRKINDSGSYKTGIDCKNGFTVDYIYDPTKKDNIKKIKEAAKEADVIYVCSDSDREGHGIAAEVADLLKQYKKKLVRTTFDEITDKAVKAAIANPSGFDNNMADAAESRAILDRLVGYRSSNLVLSKIGAPSAGRVQSALLNILSEKELAIQKFKPTTYYEVFLDYKKGNSNLTAKLCQIKEKKVDRITDKAIVDEVLKNCKAENYTVEKIVAKEKLIEPKLPLTTATLQQLASNILGWAPAKTQKNAQTLYEKGLCTYIRTDAVRFSDDFIASAKEYIEKEYGKEFYRGLNIPEDKNKDAQNAHESIHQTDVGNTPSKISSQVESDELKLYKLIYNYSLASLFVPAKVKDTDVFIENGVYHFKSSGRTIVFESFLQLTNDIDDAKKLPEFKKGDKINDKELYSEEKQTQPPQRYSEAGLVKLMQDTGIGRPSTFSSTIETLKKREYIKIEKKAVIVTELGLKLNKFLTTYFDGTFEPEYTAKMEEHLDEISLGKKTEKSFLEDFWKEFEPIVLKAARDANKEKEKPEIIEGMVCPNCGAPLYKRKSKFGNYFAACSKFPKCRYTSSLNDDTAKQEEEIPCPECGQGHMIKRKSKKGDVFYGCSRYPDCKSTMNEQKMAEYLNILHAEKDKSKDKE